MKTNPGSPCGIEVSKLPTKRLLAFYRSERLKFYHKGWFCDCCGTPVWELDNAPHLKVKYNEEVAYLDSIKQILNTRQHIQ